MIGQIGYLGEVSSLTRRTLACLFIVGAVLGGAAAGTALGALGWVLLWLVGIPASADSRAALLAVGICALLGGLRDLGLLRFRLPDPNCQVPQWWREALSAYWTAFLWGSCIGAGMRTRYRYAMLYVLGLWMLLSGSPLWGAGVLGLYGAAHGVTVLGATELGRLSMTQGVVDTLNERSERFYAVSGICLVTTSVLLLSWAVNAVA